MISNQLDAFGNKGLIKILVISDDEQLVEKIRNSGFQTYAIVSSDTSAEGLKAAIRAVSEGLCVFSQSLLQGLRPVSPAQMDHPAAGLDEHLTTREMMVLQQLADGKANKQIAQALGISENTVKFHICINLYQVSSKQPDGSDDQRGAIRDCGVIIFYIRLILEVFTTWQCYYKIVPNQGWNGDATFQHFSRFKSGRTYE